MIVIYILAVIGGLSVLGVAMLIFLFVLEEYRDRKNGEQDTEDTKIICALTMERCIFTVQRNTCNDCPIAEEAERLGKIRNPKNEERTAESPKDL